MEDMNSVQVHSNYGIFGLFNIMMNFHWYQLLKICASFGIQNNNDWHLLMASWIHFWHIWNIFMSLVWMVRTSHPKSYINVVMYMLNVVLKLYNYSILASSMQVWPVLRFNLKLFIHTIFYFSGNPDQKCNSSIGVFFKPMIIAST